MIQLPSQTSFVATEIIFTSESFPSSITGSKGDFDGAISQYVKTIGNLEPSYVIRKFLDAQRIHNLTTYLQALHEKGLANADHTTLLFNCYTKLKDVKKLDEFIKTDSELNFEVETAIKACRQAGYYDHALYLAKRHQEHDWYLKILLEDQEKHTEALNYIGTLDFFEAENNLKKYGKVLVTHIADQTTSLLIRLCTDYSHFQRDDGEMGRVRATPDEFVHIFVSKPHWLTTFLEAVVTRSDASPHLFNTLLELYLRNETTQEETPSTEKQTAKLKKAYELLTNPQSQYNDDHALVLCKMYNFRDGLLYLYEKLAL